MEAVEVVAVVELAADSDLVDRFAAVVLEFERLVVAYVLVFDIAAVVEHKFVVVECKFAVVVYSWDFPRSFEVDVLLSL